VITEHESNLNGCSLMERVDRALYFYSSLFGCMDSTVTRTSVEGQTREHASWRANKEYRCLIGSR